MSIFRKSIGKIQVSVKSPCWVTKATNTHLQYVISIAFPRQQWLRERASNLPYTQGLNILKGKISHRCGIIPLQ